MIEIVFSLQVHIAIK